MVYNNGILGNGLEVTLDSGVTILADMLRTGSIYCAE